MVSHQRRAIGLFPTYETAENALRLLRASNFSMSQVSVIAKDIAAKSDLMHDNSPIGETNVRTLEEETRVDEGAKVGATTGGAIGGLTGLLVGLGALAIPGVGPVMLAGAATTAIASALTGSAIGAAAGGLLGGLIGLGIPEEQAQRYSDSVGRGEYLLIIDGTPEEISQAEKIMSNQGIRDWKIYNANNVQSYTDRDRVKL